MPMPKRRVTSAGAASGGRNGRSSPFPQAAGHRLHVMYRAFEHDPGTDHLRHPEGERVELPAQDEGHFTGPGPSSP